MTPITSVRLCILATILLALLSASFVSSPSSGAENTIDLGALILSEEQASSPAMTFRRVSNESHEMRLSGFGMRQEQRAHYEAADERASLKIKLIEFTSNRAAGRVSVPENVDTPTGFPPGTEYEVEDNGSGEVDLSVVKGRIGIYVSLIPAKGTSLSHSEADGILRHVTAAQFERLPMTSDLQSDEINVTQIILIAAPIATVPLIALWLVLSSNLRDIGTLERLFRSNRQSRSTTFVDLTPTVRRVRRAGLKRSSLQLLAASALVAAVALVPPLLGVRRTLSLTLLGPPLALAVGIAVYVMLSRRGSSGLPFRKEPRWPLIAGTVGAMAVLFLATYLFFGVAGMLTLVASKPVRVVLFAIYVPIGLKLLRQSARPLRFAKQLAASDVEETLAADPRQEVLLLRSFQDDSLVIRMHRTARHSPIEMASAQPFDRFEELLAWALWRIGPVVAIGQPTTEKYLQPLGAAREFYSDDDWQRGAEARMKSSSVIVFVVGRSPGLWWEVSNVQRLNLVAKCLFVFPPVDYEELRERLHVLAAALGMSPQELPAVDAVGRRLIGLHFDENGSPVLIGVDGRDDLAYQTMFEIVGPTLAVRERFAVASSFVAPAEPSPAVMAKMEAFHPNKGEAPEPTLVAGLLYMYRMLTRRES